MRPPRIAIPLAFSDASVRQGAAQGVDPSNGRLWSWALAHRGLRLRTLVLLRWVAIAGQTTTVLYVALILKFNLPLLACLAVIGISAAANLIFGVVLPGLGRRSRLAQPWEAAGHLMFDLAEQGLLLALTGGLANPFLIMLAAPPTVAAATLPPRQASLVAGVAGLIAILLFIASAPLPWIAGASFDLPWIYRFGLLTAILCGVSFSGAYAWQASAEAARMELALTATQAVLAREQRLSALGGLAAAAAHELGTPLATIQVVVSEMARDPALSASVQEDVTLLAEQADRCRQILRKLAQSPEAGDSHHNRMSVTQLLEEVSEPYQNPHIRISGEVTCSPEAPLLEIRRMPEVIHALSAFVENASDFANARVEVCAHYDQDHLRIEVRDDGPGFPFDVLARLGEPYVTTRSQGEGSRSHHHGMGLGFFIAKTLLERTGATVDFRNARRGGALITMQWSRSRIEVAS